MNAGRLVFVLFISGIVLCLCSCGFHLRGMVDMPAWLNNVAILTETGNQDLDPLLRDRLMANHIVVRSDPTIANCFIIIAKENFQQQITSVSSSTTPRQYQLLYTVIFKLQNKQGKLLVPPSTVSVSRQITINSDRILGSDEEEDITKAEMRREAVIQIINRLSQYTRYDH